MSVMLFGKALFIYCHYLNYKDYYQKDKIIIPIEQVIGNSLFDYFFLHIYLFFLKMKRYLKIYVNL